MIPLRFLPALCMYCALTPLILASDNLPSTATNDPSLVRYYPFEKGYGDRAVQLAGDGDGELFLLHNSPYDVPNDLRANRWLGPVEGTTWNQGRFPDSYSIRPGVTRNSVIRSHFYNEDNSSFSFEMWLRPHPTGGQRGPIAYAGSGIKDGYQLHRDNDSLTWRLATEAGPISVRAQGVDAKRWHQVVVTWDNNLGKSAIYVDGQLADEATTKSAHVPAESNEESWKKMPEQDFGGLNIGGEVSSQVGAARFDLDEFKVYTRALSADFIAASYQAEKLDISAAEEVAAFDREMHQEAVLDAIQLSIPKDSYGYFPINKPLSATFSVPANDLWTGALTATWHLEDRDGDIVNEGQLDLKVTPEAGAEKTTSLTVDKAGLYFLRMAINDANGATIKWIEYPIGMIVPLPPIEDYPATSPLASHGMIQRCPESAAVGFGKVERIIRNGGIETEPGVYDYSYEDEIIGEAVSRGMEIMYCMNAVPDTMDEDPNATNFNLASYKKRLTALVRRYKDQVQYWEILNEPNSGHHTANLGRSPQARAKKYVAILKASYEIIRQEDPDAKIVGISGCPGFVPWLEQVLAAGGAPYFDIVTIHNYRPAPIQSSNREDQVGQVKRILEHYGKDAQIWNGEFGLKQPTFVDNRPMTEEQFQAQYAHRFVYKYGQPFIRTFMPLVQGDTTAAWTIQMIFLDLADGCSRVFLLAGPGNAYPNYVSDGLPTIKGVAMAAAASVLLDMDSIQRLPMASIRDAGALWTNHDGRRYAVVFSDDTPELFFRVEGMDVIEGMDMLGNPMQWAVKDGIIQVQASKDAVYFKDVPESFAQVPIVEVQGDGILSGKEMSGTIVYNNPTGDDQVYTLQSSLPDGIQLKTKKTVTVPAHSNQQVVFSMHAEGLKRGIHELEFSVNDAHGQLLAKTQYMLSASEVTVNIPRFTKAVPLTANPQAWQGIPAVTINDESFVLSGKPVPGVPWAPQWKGADDLSLSYRLAWHPDEGICFLIEVQDDMLRPASDDDLKTVFQHDCVELFLDVRPHDIRQIGYAPGAEQLLIRPEIGETVQTSYFRSSANANSQFDAQFVSKRTEHGYMIEGRIQPKSGAPWKIEEGMEFAFDLMLDDADEQLRKTILGIGFGDLGNAKSTDKWGWYRLGGPLDGEV